MTSYKTTIAGIIAFIGVAANAITTAINSGVFTGKTGFQLVLAVGLLLMGLFAKDSNVTGGNTFNGKTPNGTK